jgi:hypothetical protein
MGRALRDVVVYDIREYRGHDGEFIGRGSPLGNKYNIGKDGTREEVIDKYKVWIQKEIDTGNREVIEELQRLRRKLDYQDVDLLCYCAPRKCHGDVIAEVLRTMKW